MVRGTVRHEDILLVQLLQLLITTDGCVSCGGGGGAADSSKPY
jgi:hypothetical protein